MTTPNFTGNESVFRFLTANRNDRRWTEFIAAINSSEALRQAVLIFQNSGAPDNLGAFVSAYDHEIPDQGLFYNPTSNLIYAQAEYYSTFRLPASAQSPFMGYVSGVYQPVYDDDSKAEIIRTVSHELYHANTRIAKKAESDAVFATYAQNRNEATLNTFLKDNTEILIRNEIGAYITNYNAMVDAGLSAQQIGRSLGTQYQAVARTDANGNPIKVALNDVAANAAMRTWTLKQTPSNSNGLYYGYYIGAWLRDNKDLYPADAIISLPDLTADQLILSGFKGTIRVADQSHPGAVTLIEVGRLAGSEGLVTPPDVRKVWSDGTVWVETRRSFTVDANGVPRAGSERYVIDFGGQVLYVPNANVLALSDQERLDLGNGSTAVISKVAAQHGVYVATRDGNGGLSYTDELGRVVVVGRPPAMLTPTTERYTAFPTVAFEALLGRQPVPAVSDAWAEAFSTLGLQAWIGTDEQSNLGLFDESGRRIGTVSVTNGTVLIEVAPTEATPGIRMSVLPDGGSVIDRTDLDGKTIARRVTTVEGDTRRIEEFDGVDYWLSVSEYSKDRNGNTTLTQRLRNGNEIVERRNGENQLLQRSETIIAPNGTQITRRFDDSGRLTQSEEKTIYDDGSSVTTVTYNTGRVERITVDTDGESSTQDVTPIGTVIAQTVGTMSSFLGLVNAIQSGKPLPILASGVNVAAALGGTSSLNGASAAVGTLGSLYSLQQALQRGDSLGALSAGANALTLGVKAYENLIGQSLGDTAIGQAAGWLNTSMVSGVNVTPLSAINLISDIAHGDKVGVVIDVMMMIPALQVVGMVLQVGRIIYGLVKGEPDPWGEVKFVFKPDGTLGLDVRGDDGGENFVRSQAEALLGVLQGFVAQVNATGEQLALIPQRLASISFQDGAFALHDFDPVTGAERRVTFLDGHPIDVAPGSPEYYRSLGEQFLFDAVSRQAIAARWEADTARLQALAGDPDAGLTELQRAQRHGLTALPLGGANTQSFRPVLLDMDGDGIQTIARDASGVSFDVDASGYFKHTAWAGAHEGMLVLDRNSNGAVDSGLELLSNSGVAAGARGIASMGWMDANADGKIAIDDPVFNELRIWQDANSNGVVDQGEVKKLVDLGISALNYKLGTFVKAGQTAQMASPDLQADTQGTAVHLVNGGILVQGSNGQVSLVVTKVNDLSGNPPGGGEDPGGGDPGNPGGGDPGGGNPGSGVQMGNDGIVGPEIIEDRALDILAVDLLANDHINGVGAAGLTLTDVFDARHGTVSLSNGVIRFTPDLDYFGPDAGFSYAARDGSGTSGQAQVRIELAAVNDAPRVVGGQGNERRPLYGFGGIGEGDRFTDVAYPRFVPGFYRAHQYDSSGGYGYFSEPIAYDYPDPFNGRLTVSDVDDTSFTFAIKHQSQRGVASIGADGSWHFELTVPLAGQDSFEVEITDAHGGKTTQTVYVDVPGVFLDVGAPIVLDLDGNGINLQSLAASQAFYALTADGMRHKTGWVGAGDGLLALDANGDGVISGKDELSFLAYKAGAQTDLEGLAAFDTDGDGRLTANDERWGEFRVWVDADGDGVSDAGELRNLTEAGLASIALQGNSSFRTVEGNTIHGETVVTRTDGSTLTAADVSFAVGQEIEVVQADGTRTVIDGAPSSGAATVAGSEQDDVLIGHSGSDHIQGGAGNDFVFDDEGNDGVEGGAGNDAIYTGAGEDLVLGGDGDDMVMAGAGNDVVFGEDGNDVLLGEDGNDVIFGGAGRDVVSGGLGNDVLSGDDGDDVLTGEWGNDGLFGGAGDDALSGNDGDDRLQGDAGNDRLDGGAGKDQLLGGLGDDEYVVDDLGDQVIEAAGEGRDRVIAEVDGYVLAANVEDLILGGPVAVTGTGNAGDNRIVGNAGDNLLFGGDGNDRIAGGQGIDRLSGGRGDDVYVVEDLSDVVIEAAGEGADTVEASVTFALSENVENLLLTGPAAINGRGNALDNRLRGNDRANVLDGGLGADILEGGQGDDTYIVDQWGDQVVERAGEGVDTVVAGIEYTLGDAVENLVLTGYATIGTGNGLDNTLRANDNGNTLAGGAGADLLIGGKGRDTLDGGTGADILRGGQGNDTYIVSDIADVVDEMANGDPVLLKTIRLLKNQIGWVQGGAAMVDAMTDYIAARPGQAIDVPMLAEQFKDMEAAWIIQWNQDWFAPLLTLDYASGSRLDGGKDTVVASFDYTLGANVENLTLADGALAGTGNALDNKLVGNAGNNVLDGRSGADFMVGGEGDDLYFVDNAGDRVLEADDFDQPWSYGLRHMTQIFKSAVNEDWWPALIDTRMAEVQAVLQEAYDNGETSIWSTNVPSILMEFYSSQHSGLLDEPLPYFTDFLSMTWNDPRLMGGHDTVHASTDYVADAGVEDVLLTGAAIAATGNLLDNLLTGNELDNILDGGAGNDTLVGGRGNDVLIGGDGDDFFAWKDGEGLDAISDLSGFDVLSLGEGLTADAFDYLTEDVDGQQRTTLIRLDADGNATAEGIQLNGSAAAGFEIEEIRFADGTTQSVQDLLAAIDTRKQPADGGEDYWGTDGDDTFLLSDAKRGVINRYHGMAGNDTIRGDWGYDYLNVSSNLSSLDSIEVLDGVNSDFRTNFILGTAGGDRWDFSGKTVRNFVIAPGDGDDIVTGTAGNDMIEGGKGADTLNGGDGDDTFLLVPGDDSVDRYDGGAGNNRIYADWDFYVLRVSSNMDSVRNVQRIESANNNFGAARIVATDGDDTLDFTGITVKNFMIDAGDGDDVVTGGDGDEWIRGGKGADTLSGGAGNDTFLLSPGDLSIDRFDGGLGSNRIFADWGMTTLRVGTTLASIQNIQRIEGVEDMLGAARIVSTDGDDVLDFTGITVKKFMIDTGDGDDVVIGGDGDDWIRGGKGTDTLNGGASDDMFVLSEGDEGVDRYDGGSGTNRIFADWGYNVLRVSSNMDSLRNIQRIESADNNFGVARIVATDGDDTLDFTGIAVKNFMIDTGGGDDVVTGSAEGNVIRGGQGSDLLIGAGGDDLYVWQKGDGDDHISDDAGDNTLDLGSYLDPSGVTVATTETGWQLQVRHDGQMSLLTIDRFQASTMKVKIDANTWSIDSLPAGDYVTPWAAASGGSATAKGAGWSSMESGDSQRLDSEHATNGLVGGGTAQRRSTSL